MAAPLDPGAACGKQGHPQPLPNPMTLSKPVRLYETFRAPNPRRVAIFLAEKALDIPREEVDIMAGQHREEPYVAFAGAPHVPALELDDGTVLTETIAICRYLEALWPEPNLMGRDPREAAEIEMWQRRMEFGLFNVIAQHVRHAVPAMAALEDQCAEWGAATRGRIDRALEELDRRLRGRSFIAINRYSVADITAQVAIDFLRVPRIEVPEELEALQTWIRRVKSRPSAMAGLERPKRGQT